VNKWTVTGAVILLVTPMFPILMLPNPRCLATVRMLWLLLLVHDLEIFMVMHVQVSSLLISAAGVVLVALEHSLCS
jgi:hypothetical protein